MTAIMAMAVAIKEIGITKTVPEVATIGIKEATTTIRGKLAPPLLLYFLY